LPQRKQLLLLSHSRHATAYNDSVCFKRDRFHQHKIGLTEILRNKNTAQTLLTNLVFFNYQKMQIEKERHKKRIKNI